MEDVRLVRITSKGATAMLAQFALELASSGHSPVTVREYVGIVRRWQRSGLSPVEYLAGLDVQASTRTMRGIVIRRFLAWAAAHGGDSENPLASVRFHAPPPTPIRPFSRAETDALLGACRTPLEEGIVLCLLELGLRASELAGVTESDAGGETVVVKGKGGKWRTLATAGLVGPLRAILAARPNYQKIYRTVRAIGRRAGLRDVHPHRFRHTFAHRFLAAGDSNDLRVLLGHSSETMTRRYTRYYEEQRALVAHRRFLQGAGGRSGRGLEEVGEQGAGGRPDRGRAYGDQPVLPVGQNLDVELDQRLEDHDEYGDEGEPGRLLQALEVVVRHGSSSSVGAGQTPAASRSTGGGRDVHDGPPGPRGISVS